MDSYSYQSQMPYVPYYYPSGQTAGPHFKVNPARSMVPYESWPFGGNQGHAHPEFHGCCYHSYQPNYYAFRPPCAYIAPHHCHGTYSAFPAVNPVQYVPPPYFSMDQPRYEFEKNLPTEQHCCGCPNHPCKQNEKKNVNIEEHDDDVDRKNDEAVIPINATRSQPYPVVWLPYDDGKREHAKPYESEHNEQEEACNEPNPPRASESVEEPILWNGWSPLNMKRSEGIKKGEDLQTDQQKQNGNNMSFPFPIFWMPYQPENAGKMERQGSDFSQKSDKELTSHIESMQKGPHNDEYKTTNSMKNEVSAVNGKKMVSKEYFPKIIPVKQLEENDMKSTSDKREGKSANASTEHNDDYGDKKLDENGAKKSSSPKKPSKLAPVCLRVDPLPKKKTQNGGSRSPNPPGGRGKSHNMPKDKPPVSVNEEITTKSNDGPVNYGLPEGASELEESKHNTRIIKVTEGTNQGDGHKYLNVGCTVSSSQSDNEKGTGGDEASFEPRKSVQCNNTEGQTKKSIKKQMSEDEAAIVIQSAYRAYEVRKWEPLKKIKQIASVREQVAEITSCIQALEHSTDSSVDNKQKTLIAETIMSLLLKLDTIQGLHPTVRDIRKSVARELVNLQEKLDSITDKNLQAVTEQPFTENVTEDTMSVNENITDMQCGTTIVKHCKDQPLPVENSQGIDELLADSQPTYKDLEEKEILEHEQCLSSPHMRAKELQSKEMDGHVKDLVELSQEEHNAQESSLSKEMSIDVEDLAEINTEFSQEKITSCVEQQVAKAQPCVVDEEPTTQESMVCRQTATGDTGMPQDEANGSLEAEPLEKEIIDMAELLLPVNSNPDNNSGCEDKAVQDAAITPNGTPVEAQVTNLGVLNEVAEFCEQNAKCGLEEKKETVESIKGELDEVSTILQGVIMETDESHETTKLNEVAEFPVPNDKSGLEENEEIFGSFKGELDKFLSTLNQEVIKETDGTTKLEEAEELSKEQLEKTECALDKEVESINQKLEEENVALESAVSATRDAKGGGSQICMESGRKLIEENEKLRKVMEELIESGKEQLTTISALSARLNQLEKKLSSTNRRKKFKTRQHRAAQLKRDAP